MYKEMYTRTWETLREMIEGDCIARDTKYGGDATALVD
jgi:hypothetical protein